MEVAKESLHAPLEVRVPEVSVYIEDIEGVLIRPRLAPFPPGWETCDPR